MPSSAELICVDPDRVHEFWPYVSELIHRAILRTNLIHTREIDEEILQKRGLLWMAVEGRQVAAAATTCIVETDKDRSCIVTACAGEDRTRWLHFLKTIETYAHNENCARVRVYGRPGWQKVLDGYSVKHVILEKDLGR